MKPKTRAATEGEILARFLLPDDGPAAAVAASAILRMRVDPADQERMHDLVTRNQCGTLNQDELAELESYTRAGLIIDLLASRAHRLLKRSGKGG